MEELTTLISNVGFPIAMAIYMTLKTTAIVEKNTEAVNDLKAEITNLKEVIKK